MSSSLNWYPNSTNTTDHNLHGQLRLWLGSELTNDQRLWLLEQGRTRNVNKRSQIESSMLCVEDTCKKIRKLYNKGFYRQHDSIEIHSKIWRNSITPTTGISSDDSGHLQRIQFESSLSTYTGDKEHQCRPTIKATAATLLTDNSKKDVSTDFTTTGPLQIDAFAATHNHQLKRYWCLHPDPMAEAQNAMAEEGNALKSSFSSDSILAQSILASNDFEDKPSRQSYYYEDQQEVFVAAWRL
ncbi:hypothetical protein G6F62_010484 [Rhizopus arrhizus]|nr:hypothetical protein G6F62_010484 [Rhizopus arrhizus]